MDNKAQSQSSILGVNWSPANAALTIIFTLLFLISLFLLMFITAQPAQGQTYQVLHNFTGGGDGATPTAGVTPDAAGNLYGTTSSGGNPGSGGGGCGTVFKLTANRGAWTEDVLHIFTGPPDGCAPNAGVVFGPDRQLYGTTSAGGMGVGTVFSLRPQATACKTALCIWTETVLTPLMYSCDGAIIGYGDVAFGGDGAVYATTTLPATTMRGLFSAWHRRMAVGRAHDIHSFYSNTEGGYTEAGVIFVGNCHLRHRNSGWAVLHLRHGLHTARWP